MRVLVVEPEAEVEIAAALEWYEEQQPGLGAALLVEVDGMLQRLRTASLPGIGVPGVRRDLRVRRVILERFPYAVIFIDRQSAVHVLAFAHHKRRPGYWRERLRTSSRGSK